MRAIGYVRVSTEEQAASGLGLEAQRAAIAAVATRRGLELLQVEADEGVSGSKPAAKRPGLSRALEQLREGDALLVSQPDRLGRDLAEGIRMLDLLEERHAVLLCASGATTEKKDAISWLLIIILLVLAEFQLRQGRERTSSAMAAKRARGERSGAIPFGFKLGPEKKLVEDLREREALELMQRERKKGEGYSAIARTLTSRGFDPRGRAWYAQSVKTILENAARRTS